MAEYWRNIKEGRDKYLPLLQWYKEILIFDTETTGLNSKAKIIQFSGIHYKILENGRFEEINRLDIYINPEEPLESKITEITGITDEMLAGAENEFEVGEKIIDFLSGSKLWGAYNAPFDLRMLNQFSERTGYAIPKRMCIDVLYMARDSITRDRIEEYSLSSIMGYLFPEEYIQFHSSIEDVKATAKCMQVFIQVYNSYQKKENTVPIHLNWASYFENPRKKSQRRIKMDLSDGEYGDIFWDVIAKAWSCKSSSKAKKMFHAIDMESLENQVMRKYAYRYQASTMEELAYNWGKDKKEKEKQKKQEEAS